MYDCDDGLCPSHGSVRVVKRAVICKLDNTNLFSDASESTSFAAFVYWVNDPANPRITANLKYEHSRKGYSKMRPRDKPLCGWDPPR